MAKGGEESRLTHAEDSGGGIFLPAGFEGGGGEG